MKLKRVSRGASVLQIVFFLFCVPCTLESLIPHLNNILPILK